MRTLIIPFLALATSGCVKSMAIGAIGDALANGGGTYAQDDDPELVRDASAFGLKLVESLLDAEPEHRGLLLAAARGYTQYGYAFLQAEADYIEEDDFRGAMHLRRRAKKFYARARRYGVRGLEVEHEDFLRRLRDDRAALLDELTDEDLALLYWTGVAWAAAVALDKDDTELAADLDLVEAMMERGRDLGPEHAEGAFHDFFLVWDAGRPKAAGGSVERAAAHLQRSLAASGGDRIAPLVSYAELVCVKQGDAPRFVELLNKAAAHDGDHAPRYRLANLVAQRRAKWLLARKDDLFLE